MSKLEKIEKGKPYVEDVYLANGSSAALVHDRWPFNRNIDLLMLQGCKHAMLNACIKYLHRSFLPLLYFNGRHWEQGEVSLLGVCNLFICLWGGGVSSFA